MNCAVRPAEADRGDEPGLATSHPDEQFPGALAELREVIGDQQPAEGGDVDKAVFLGDDHELPG